MKVLVACEESQAVTIAFRKAGHEAYSCDIQECSGGHPEWHIQGDAVIEAYSGKYDMMIAHPPCTYISNAGAVHLFPNKVLSFPRYALGMEGKKFFMQLYNAPIEKIMIENPLPSGIFNLPKHTQVIQPFQFGHPLRKRTLLWLKNLPALVPTNDLGDGQSTKVPGNWYNKGGKERQKNRSKTFPGIAQAMAEQWGGLDS